jgi:N-acetylmuramoyl-L-alanine amidase
MNVIKNLVSSNKYKIKCPYTMNAEFIVVHNTANDATARNEIAYMIKNDNQVSFHYAIDDKEIVQGIPENRNAWHAGDGGSGEGNRKGLSVEICYSKSGGQRFIDAEKLSARFIAFKLNEKGWGIDKVKKHQDFSGKYCPHRTLDMGWQRFLNMVQAELDKFKGGINMGNQTKTPQINNNKPSAWAKEAWELAKKEGYLDGTRPHDPITREEMAIVIQRLVKNIG